MPNVNNSFSKFISDVITPSDYYFDTLFPARRKSVFEDLADAFPSSSDITIKAVKYLGSASKRTMISPVDDLDVLAEFELSLEAYLNYANDSFAFINRIRRAYDGYNTQVVGTRGQAVRVFYEKFGHVDIAPVYRVDQNTYNIPDGKGGWMFTSPEVANDWFFERHKTLNYKLKTLVKLIKKWNRVHSSRLSSFHLETMAASMFAELGNWPDFNLTEFFRLAPNWLSVYDPGGHSGDLSANMTLNTRVQVLTSFSAAHQKGVEAWELEKAGNHDNAIDKWRIILGSDFPKV